MLYISLTDQSLELLETKKGLVSDEKFIAVSRKLFKEKVLEYGLISDAKGLVTAFREALVTAYPKEIKDIKKEKLDGMKLLRASTTDMFKRANEERREVTKNMKMEAFQIRKNALEEHLLVAVNNLTNIANRIEAHIVKVEASRRTLTDAKALLVTAREKIAIAKTDIEALKALETADTSTEINLTKPREIGDKAIKSIKDAKESLKKVIVSIAKNMGIGNTASTTDGSSGDENDNDNDN